MKKKFFALMLSFAMVFGTVTAYAESIEVTKNKMTVYVNGTQITEDNFIYNDITYVPIRPIGDALNATITFNAMTNTADITVASSNRDVGMSNRVIATAYGSELTRLMYLVFSGAQILIDNNSSTYRDLTSSASDNLRDLATLLEEYQIDVLYDACESAIAMCDNADKCVTIAKRGTLTAEFYDLLLEMQSDFYDALDAIQSVNMEACNYVIEAAN